MKHNRKTIRAQRNRIQELAKNELRRMREREKRPNAGYIRELPQAWARSAPKHPINNPFSCL